MNELDYDPLFALFAISYLVMVVNNTRL